MQDEISNLTQSQSSIRARDFGIVFHGEPGRLNSIQDVPDIGVGYLTISETGVRHTGVTAIIPRTKTLMVPCAAATFSLNGEMTESTLIEESGALSGPICLTSTSAVGVVHRAVLDWLNQKHAECGSQWLLPVVAETYDGYLTDLNGPCHIHADHVFSALDSAENCSTTQCIDEGSVGGGAGMNSFGYKAGSGTSSRVVAHGSSNYAVGVFVQSNFGRRIELTIAGVSVGQHLQDDNPMSSFFSANPVMAAIPTEGSGSIIAVVATDAPLLPLQLEDMAKRVSLGIARTGSICSHFSEDIFIAFSTADQRCALSSCFPGVATDQDYETMRFIPWGHMDKFFSATVQATEEAIVNALCASSDTIGFKNRRSPGIPMDRVAAQISGRN